VNLVGLTVDEAAKALKQYELSVGTVTTEPSATVPAGRITRQRPDIGEQVKKGDKVDVTVSSGGP
jgi:beta-lactam-binding protein with PASTA domain